MFDFHLCYELSLFLQILKIRVYLQLVVRYPLPLLIDIFGRFLTQTDHTGIYELEMGILLANVRIKVAQYQVYSNLN